MIKKFAILDSENKKIISAIQKHFNNNVKIITRQDNLNDYELVVLTGFETEFPVAENIEVINIHPSILPAFAHKEAIKEAFLAGVKVSGITIHKVEATNFYGKIIAQIPILIGNSTHFDELENEIINLAAKIYPKVIETVLNDTVFDFSVLLNTGCTNSCSGGCGKNCNNCSH